MVAGSLEVQFPNEVKDFVWLLLIKKSLTWDVSRVKGRDGPGRCYLCKNAKESNFHLATWIVFILGLCGQKLEKK